VNSNRLDLNLLRVFDAILQTRSVTIAASTLSLTQSAGSGGLNSTGKRNSRINSRCGLRISGGAKPRTPTNQTRCSSHRSDSVPESRSEYVRGIVS